MKQIVSSVIMNLGIDGPEKLPWHMHVLETVNFRAAGMTAQDWDPWNFSDLTWAVPLVPLQPCRRLKYQH